MIDKTQISDAVRRLAKHFDTVDNMWPLRIHRESIDMELGELCDTGTRFTGLPVLVKYGCCCIVGQLCGSYADEMIGHARHGKSRWIPSWADHSIALTWPSTWHEGDYMKRDQVIKEWAAAAEAAWIAEIDRRMPMIQEWLYLAS